MKVHVTLMPLRMHLQNDLNADMRVWVTDERGNTVRAGVVDLWFPRDTPTEMGFSCPFGNLHKREVEQAKELAQAFFKNCGYSISKFNDYAPGPL